MSESVTADTPVTTSAETTTTSSVELTDVVSAGEELFTAITGNTVSPKVAGYVNDGALLVTSALSLFGRTVNADAAVVNTGLLEILKGVTSIVSGFKNKAAS